MCIVKLKIKVIFAQHLFELGNVAAQRGELQRALEFLR